MDFQIQLRPFRSDDAAFVNRLRQDEALEEVLGNNKRPVSYERDVKWVQDVMMGDNQHAVYFCVTKKDDDEIIGYASITDIDYRNGTCYYSIKLDSAKCGKGYGTEAALKIVKYVFEELRMERCASWVLEHNVASIKMLEKVGYVKEGLSRNSLYKNNQYNNQWLFGIIKSDYEKIKIQYSL